MFKSLFVWVRNNFGFSKTETNGFIVLIPIMLFLLVAPSLYTHVFSKRYNNSVEDQAILDSLLVMWNENVVLKKSAKKLIVPTEFREIELQEFDPNIADIELLQKVGIPYFLAQRIINYRAKGATFKIRSDLQKIYDFPDTLFTTLEAFIQLPDQLSAMKEVMITEKALKVEPEKVRIKKELVRININEADTADYKMLKGVGKIYAARIIKYRSILGGFVEVDQLKEVYGISDSLVNSLNDQLLINDSYRPRKLKINIATFKELLAHPYISYEQAGDILNTKSKYGKFKKDSDLMKLNLFSTTELKKLKPYLTY